MMEEKPKLFNQIRPIIPKTIPHVRRESGQNLMNGQIMGQHVRIRENHSSQLPTLQEQIHCRGDLFQAEMSTYPGQQPKQELNVNKLSILYYNEYLRLYSENRILNNQLNLIQNQKKCLITKMHKIQKENNSFDKAKRHRRTLNEISRSFICPIIQCNHKYGSEGSLIQHIKLKHKEDNKQNYDQILQEIKRNKLNEQKERQQGQKQCYKELFIHVHHKEQEEKNN